MLIGSIPYRKLFSPQVSYWVAAEAFRNKNRTNEDVIVLLGRLQKHIVVIVGGGVVVANTGIYGHFYIIYMLAVKITPFYLLNR